MVIVTESLIVAPAVAFVTIATGHCVDVGIVIQVVVPVLLQAEPFDVKFNHRALVPFNMNLTYTKSSGLADGFTSGASLMLVVPDVALFLTKVTFSYVKVALG